MICLLVQQALLSVGPMQEISFSRARGWKTSKPILIIRYRLELCICAFSDKGATPQQPRVRILAPPRFFSLYCLVCEQYWDQNHLVQSNWFHKCSYRWHPELSTSKKWILWQTFCKRQVPFEEAFAQSVMFKWGHLCNKSGLFYLLGLHKPETKNTGKTEQTYSP